MNYYSNNAEEYIEKTKDLDMSSEINRFLELIGQKGTILDLGFGSGRDSLYFQNLGYEVYSMDSTKEFCEHGRKIGLKNIIEGYAQNLNFQNKFDGIWACASLLHLSSNDLIKTLNKCKEALKKDGIMYVSFKYGDFEGLREERFYNDMTKDKFMQLCNQTELHCIDSWISSDKQNRSNEWISFLLS